MSKTSWSTSHLVQLSSLHNHRIIYDGYEYVWEHLLDGVWSRHYVANFDNHKKPYAWLLTCVHNWSKELKERERIESKHYWDDMFEDLEKQEKISVLSRKHKLKTKEKAIKIKELKPDMSNRKIAKMLDVSVRSVERYLKK